MSAPDVRYADNAGVSIAFQVFGEGPRDLLIVCGTMSHLELWWADPLATAMLERMAQFNRVILFDKPGTGLSDPIPAAPTIDQRTDDLLAVMDAARSEHAVILGYSEGGAPATVLAATQPQRVEALVLLDSAVALEPASNIDVPPEAFDRVWSVLDRACASWGEGILMAAMAPTWAAKPRYESILGAVERACMSPAMARSVLQGYHGIDVSHAADAVRVPTLVLHCEESFISPAFGRDLARRIEGATFVPLDGPDHLVWIHNSEAVPDAIEEFLTGETPGPHDSNRVLTTVVFTDIVHSTRELARAGDSRWRALLADHDRRMDTLLTRFGGEPVKHTGDGRLVHFSRPARAVRFAAAMTEAARSCGLEIRVGIHTGECEVVDGDLVGLVVNIAARVAAVAPPSAVLVTRTVKDLVVGSGLSFAPNGEHELRGVPETWPLFRFQRDRPGPLVATGYETDVRNPLPLESTA